MQTVFCHANSIAYNNNANGLKYVYVYIHFVHSYGLAKVNDLHKCMPANDHCCHHQQHLILLTNDECCRFYFVHCLCSVCSTHVYEVQSQFHGDNAYATHKHSHISFQQIYFTTRISLRFCHEFTQNYVFHWAMNKNTCQSVCLRNETELWRTIDKNHGRFHTLLPNWKHREWAEKVACKWRDINKNA